MKKIAILLIILLFFLPSWSVPPTLNLQAEETEGYAYAGTLAMSPVVKRDKEDKDEDKSDKCDHNCKNGNISYDGGTSWTACPCRANGKKCECYSTSGDSVTESPALKEEDLLPRVVLVTQPYNKNGKPNCVPCISVDRDVVNVLKDERHKKSGWDVGVSARNDVQILDLNNPDSLEEIERLGLDFDAIPTFFFMRKDKTVTKIVGGMSYKEFIKECGK
jgi:hypothetical protein